MTHPLDARLPFMPKIQALDSKAFVTAVMAVVHGYDYTVPCPACDAEADEPCTDIHGEPTPGTHAERIVHYLEATP